MRKYTKILSLICALTLSLSFLTVISIASGTGTEADPYIITTAQELQNINNNVTAHYKLGNNIDLADMDFTPIGNADSGAFSGSFDGNGYKISNLNVFSGKYAGLFGSNEGVIKNVILDNIYVYGTRYVGGVVGQNTNCGTVENCTVLSGLVESDGGINALNIGGICGINEGAFSGSFSNGADIDATSSESSARVGGICGYWNSNITNEVMSSYNKGNVSSDSDSYSGGLVGYAYSSITISGCYNTGNVSSGYRSGGLVGYAYSSITISGCYNTGNVSSGSYPGGLVGYVYSSITISSCYNTGNVSSGNRSGGLVGYADSTITINDCYNTGNVSSKYNSGGLVCYAKGTTTIISCYNTGSVSSIYNYTGGLVGYADSTITINGCYNTGNVSTSDTDYTTYSGGLVGRADSTITINGCYNTGNVSSDSYSGGLVGYSPSSKTNCASSYMIKGSVVNHGSKISGVNGICLSWSDMKNMLCYTAWDFEGVWDIGGDCNHAYPVLRAVSSPLTINIPNKIMSIDETVQLTAYKNGVKTTDVSWSVTTGAGTVNSSGLVSVCVGLVTVTATDNEGNKANLNIYACSPAVSMSAKNRTLAMSSSSYPNSSYFTISGSDTDYIVDYQSNDASVVKVDEVSGALTPVSAGTATITATTMGGATATQTVTVTAEAESISLPSTLTIARGATKKVTATTSPDPTSSIITWESSDSSVATVDSEGNVTGLKCGTTIITATTDNGYSDTCTVTVNAPITEMAFETPSLTLYVGQEYKLKLNISPTDTTDTITYSTSSSTYASVTSAGTVTAKKAGTATITATSSSGKKAYCVVTVKAWPSVFTLVDSTTTINENIITTDTTGVRNLEKIVTVKDGYNIEVIYSHQINGLNYCGTGTTIDVYDDYGNFVITYTLVVNGDVNGDSFCDVLDASTTEKMSTDAITYNESQAYAANGTAIETIDVTSYQYVLNKALDF